MIITLAAFLLQAAPAEASPPSLDTITAAVESNVRGQLVDRESARFEWPYELAATKNGGFYTCGRFNSKNRMGGYAGASWFSVAIKDGQITSVQTEDLSPWIAYQCAKAACKGELRIRTQSVLR